MNFIPFLTPMPFLVSQALIRCPRLTVLVAATLVVPHPVEPAVRAVGISGRLTCAAISPPLTVAEFHPSGYGREGHIGLVREVKETLSTRAPRRTASISHPWSSTMLSFARERVTSSTHRHWSNFLDPARVQELVLNTRTRKEAAEIVEEAFGCKVGLNGLSIYLKRHGLIAPWQTPRWEIEPHEVSRFISGMRTRKAAAAALSSALGRPISGDVLTFYVRRHKLLATWARTEPDPKHEIVQRIISNTTSRSEALECLRLELGWSRSLRYFDKYVNEHNLKAPWRMKVARQVDRSQMQQLIEQAHTLSEALQLVHDKLGRPIAMSTLSNYIKRHRIATPWQRRQP
jgi:hypothetical protein